MTWHGTLWSFKHGAGILSCCCLSYRLRFSRLMTVPEKVFFDASSAASSCRTCSFHYSKMCCMQAAGDQGCRSNLQQSPSFPSTMHSPPDHALSPFHPPSFGIRQCPTYDDPPASQHSSWPPRRRSCSKSTKTEREGGGCSEGTNQSPGSTVGPDN